MENFKTQVTLFQMMKFQDVGEDGLEQRELASPTSIVCDQSFPPTDTFTPTLIPLMGCLLGKE